MTPKDGHSFGPMLGAVAIIVPDYEVGIRFFNAIGFDTTQNLDQGRKRWVTVQPKLGGVSLVIARAENAEQRAMIGNQGGGRVWLFLHSDDFDRDAAAIVAAGGTFEESPRDEPYGRVAIWRDPWGNRWDLIAQHPISR